jgi:hypothetical protein
MASNNLHITHSVCFVCSWALEDKISFAAIAKLFFGKDEPNFN